ncbi:MAG: polysaccharide pyruvyl transferase family protein [Bacteroidaceae bacterium]|jgi:hypothetical protein
MGKGKKKVCIVTILDVANFGTMLQAYALGTVVERMGYDVEFVDYWRRDYTTGHKVRTFLRDSSLGSLPRRVAFALSALLMYAPIRRRVRRFVTRRFRMSRPYHSFDRLRQRPPYADFFICGSDQIWNSTYNGGLDRTFFLDFTTAPRIAYAASSGLDAFSEEELPEIRALLEKFAALSVREYQTCDYLRRIGFPKVQHVLDPSLLLNAEEWRRVAGCAGMEDCKEEPSPYLLVYSVERFNNDFIFSQARRIARDRGLRMYVVCTTYPVKARDYGFDKVYAMADVPTFLRLMAGASFVVASSFHGTAFALNFNKDFITISAGKYNIRMESLVRQFGIAHRIVEKEEVSAASLRPIDYEVINQKLAREREASFSFLCEALTANSPKDIIGG